VSTVQLSPTVVELLRVHLRHQSARQLAAGPAWQKVTYEGQEIALVFTVATGGLAARQYVTKALHAACMRAGIDPIGLGTHSGRRSVVTALYADGVPLEDVARHVGHASTTTTMGYVHDLANRPADTARRAADLFDPALGAEV
jgi:integrase